MSTEKQIPELIKAKPVRHYGRWISAAIVAVLALMIIDTLTTNENYHWDVVAANLFKPIIIQGIGWTLLLTIGAMALGIAIALTMAIMRQSENPVLRIVSTVYIWFFRGTPIYTQLIFWGLLTVLYPTFGMSIPFTSIELFSFDPTELTELETRLFIFAVLGLGFNEGAYLAEIVRSGLNSIDPGQEEAAKALGMNKSLIFRRIIIPQAMRVIIPPTGNETISMLKTTSLVTAVPVSVELTAVTNRVGFSAGTPVPYLIVAALWYLVVTSILMVGQYFLERHYGRGVRDNSPALKAHGTKQRKIRMSRQAAISAAHTSSDMPFIDVTP